MRVWDPGYSGGRGGLGRCGEIPYLLFTSWYKQVECSCCGHIWKTRMYYPCWRLQETRRWGWSQCDLWSEESVNTSSERWYNWYMGSSSCWMGYGILVYCTYILVCFVFPLDIAVERVNLFINSAIMLSRLEKYPFLMAWRGICWKGMKTVLWYPNWQIWCLS